MVKVDHLYYLPIFQQWHHHRNHNRVVSEVVLVLGEVEEGEEKEVEVP